MRLSIVLICSLLLALALPAKGQHSVVVPGWKRPTDTLVLTKGMHVRFITKDKRDLKGTIQSVSPEKIELEKAGIDPKDIAFAHSHKHSKAARQRLLLLVTSPLWLAIGLLGLALVLACVLLIIIDLALTLSGEKLEME